LLTDVALWVYCGEVKIAEANGLEVHLPTTGGKAGRGNARTGSIQVRDSNMIVKQFRFLWADAASRAKAIDGARAFMRTIPTRVGRTARGGKIDSMKT
jgi:hypothetical protein